MSVREQLDRCEAALRASRSNAWDPSWMGALEGLHGALRDQVRRGLGDPELAVACASLLGVGNRRAIVDLLSLVREQCEPSASGGPIDLGVDPVFEDTLREFRLEAQEHLAEAEAALRGAGPHAEAIRTAFRAFHNIKGVAGVLGIDGMADLTHEAEGLLEVARAGDAPLEAHALDLMLGAAATIERMADALCGLATAPAVGDLTSLVGGIRREAARCRDRGAPSAVHELVARTAAAPDAGVQAWVRVPSAALDRVVGKLDSLAVGALWALGQRPGTKAEADGARRRHAIDELVRDALRAGAELRRTKLAPMLQKLERAAADHAARVGKEVECVVTGGELAVDRSLAEGLSDPLVHLVRNAVAHGIEDGETRAAAGKPPAGRIRVAAHWEGDGLVVEVEDDGRGFDADGIRAQARAHGRIPADQIEAWSEQEILQLVFEPGLSTAPAVTEWAGRGVGMDIVRAAVVAAGGQVTIESAAGRGSTVQLRLPPAPDAMRCLVVGDGAARYLVPLDSVVGTGVEGGLAERPGVPGCSLAQLLELGSPERQPTDPARGGVVVELQAGTRTARLSVDAICGQEQVVVVPLAGDTATACVVGGAALEDGTVAWVLDPRAIVARALAEVGAPPAPEVRA